MEVLKQDLNFPGFTIGFVESLGYWNGKQYFFFLILLNEGGFSEDMAGFEE